MDAIKPVKEFKAGKMTVKVYENREQMGKAAAAELKKRMDEVLKSKDELRMIFAAAPSQNETLEALQSYDVDWNRISAFHMDEYIGIDPEAPQSFGKFLRDAIFDRQDFKRVELIDPLAANTGEECERYGKLINEKPVDVCALGIGENGHLAFNDPPVADFNDPETMKVVTLDSVCRMQQVNDGCFSSLELVPEKAFTLTIPVLLKCTHLILSVPGKTKARAVHKTVNDPVSTKCPSTILRNYNAVMFIDKDAAAEIL